MTTKTLPSGRTLNVNVAPFSAANKLHKAIAAELLKVDVDVGKIDGKKLTLDADVLSLDAKLLNTLKNVVCRLLASDAVEAAYLECAGRSTIDGAKITRESFEAADHRGDWLPVAWEVMRENVAPFFASLDLSSLTAPRETRSGPPSA